MALQVPRADAFAAASRDRRALRFRAEVVGRPFHDGLRVAPWIGHEILPVGE